MATIVRVDAMRSVILLGLIVLAPSLTAGQVPDRTPRQRYEALLKEYASARDIWSKTYDDGFGRGDAVKRHQDWPGWSFAPRFLKLALDHPEDPAAVDALLWVVGLDQNVGENQQALLPLYGRAVDILAQGHLQDKRVQELCLENVAHDLSVPAERFLRAVLALGPTREARGYACLGLAQYLATKRTVAQDPWFDRPAKTPFDSYSVSRLDPSFFEYIHGADPQALYDEAGRLFERTILEFADIKSPPRGRPLAEIARSGLHELRDLSLGRGAPEIEGRDVEGDAFKLSDYRGKVVVLTFSGNWCGPCRAMYPDERELVKRLKNSPFALLSVNTDADRATLQKSIKDAEITWRCWWEGGLEGPICKNWNITSFPTVYVLDGTGAIRFKNVRGSSLDDAVKFLLKELEASRRNP
jgi:thiol-disulfide isomerase/thioredoxin